MKEQYRFVRVWFAALLLVPLAALQIAGTPCNVQEVQIIKVATGKLPAHAPPSHHGKHLTYDCLQCRFPIGVRFITTV